MDSLPGSGVQWATPVSPLSNGISKDLAFELYKLVLWRILKVLDKKMFGISPAFACAREDIRFWGTELTKT